MMKEKKYGIFIVALIGIIPGLAFAQSSALEMSISKTSVSPGEVVEIVISADSSDQAVTAIETFIQYDSDMFERVGLGDACDSSEFQEIKKGDWFIESCLPEDIQNKKSYFIVSKAVAFSEAGYGVLDSAENLYGMLLRVKPEAEGSSDVILSGSGQRVSKIFYDGVQYSQNEIRKTISIKSTSSSSSRSSVRVGSEAEQPQSEDAENEDYVEKPQSENAIMVIEETPEGYDMPEGAKVVGVTSKKDLETGFEEISKVALEEIQQRELVEKDLNLSEGKAGQESSKTSEDSKTKKPFWLLLAAFTLGGILYSVTKK